MRQPFSALLAACVLPAVAISLLAGPSSAGAAEESCPNSTLRTELSANLPDCRAYEQVSPVEKDGGSGGVFYFDSPSQRNVWPMQSVADGSLVTYPGEPFYQIPPSENEKIGIEGTPGSDYTFRQQYTSKRSAVGWNTQRGDTLPQEEVPGSVIPTSVAPNPRTLEESPSGVEVFYTEAGALYEYNTVSNVSTDLTSDAEPGGAEVEGLLGVGGEGTKEGAYVYFVAGGLLAPGAATGGCITSIFGLTTGTGCNLFLRHDGSTIFIATLSPEDEEESLTFGFGVIDWGESSKRTAEVSPNGRYVAFASWLALTGQNQGRPQIFRYDAENPGHPIVCVSCSPIGGPLAAGAIPLVSTRAAVNGVERQRYMLNDGRVLFDTSNALVLQDVNQQTDVYEWEPEGVGSCTAATTTGWSQFVPEESGCVSLISGGTSEVSDAILTDVSASGSDIFFTTSQSLVPQDDDGINDLYDAREGGGFPSPPAPACPIERVCPGAVAGAPTFGAPTSATFLGTEGPAIDVTIKGSVKKREPLIRVQKLSNALKACHARRNKKKRIACEVSAQKRYGHLRSVHKTKALKRG